MSAYSPIKIKYDLQNTYPGTAQRNWVGAQTEPLKRGWWNNFADAGADILSMYLDKDRYVYYVQATSGTAVTLKVWDILLGTGQTLGVTTAASGATGTVFVDAGYVYLGGNFSHITPTGGTSTARTYLCRFVKSTYALDTWAPTVSAAIVQNCLTGDNTATGSTVYVSLVGTPTTFKAFNNTGSATSWAPTFGITDNGAKVMLYVAKGTDGNANILVGGDFSSPNATSRINICEIGTASTGTVTAFDPQLNGICYSVAFDSTNSLVYAGGIFTSVNTLGTPLTRHQAASFTFNGIGTTWNPNCTGGTYGVEAIALATSSTTNDRVYLGGDFTAIGGTSRPGIGKVDTLSNLKSFKPPLTGATLGVSSLLVFDRTVYVGGDFTGVSTGIYPVMQGGTYGAYLDAFPDPLFSNANAIFISKAGSDSNAGTFAATVLTIAYAQSLLTGALVYAVICDSGTYSEIVTWSTASTGLYALDGFAPTITPQIGAVVGTYGARVSGRTKFYAGTNTYYVSKQGNDGTGTLNTPSLPFLTVQGAVNAGIAAATSDYCVQIQDSGTYNETINGGAYQLTIQAANGQIPTLKNFTSTNSLAMTAGTKLSVYGLAIIGPTINTVNEAWNTASALDLYDCSTNNGFGQTAGSFDTNVYNCSFYGRSGGIGAASSGTCTIHNSFFSKSIGAAAGHLANFSVSQCTFENAQAQDVASTSRGNIDVSRNASTSTVNISFCEFSGGYCDGVSMQLTTASSTTAVNISNCYFHDLQGAAINNISQGAVVGYLSVSNCLAENNNPSVTLGDYNIGGPSQTLSNCVSLSCSKNGVYAITVTGGTNATISNFTVVNAGSNGLYLTGGATGVTATITGLIEKNSGTYSVTSGSSVQLYNSVYEKPISGALVGSGLGNYNVDPLVVSSVTDFEDISLFPNSLGILNGDTTGSSNAGNQANVFYISAASVAVDGLIISGLKNLYQGIKEISNSASSIIRYCSFSELTFSGIFKASPGEVSNCLFENNGIGILVTSGQNNIKRNEFVGNTACGILNGALGSNYSNNSAYSCAYAQFDLGASLAISQKNQVFSDSSVYDYSGIGTQTYSDIGTLSTNATVDANSTRLNPLYNNPDAGDLRIQAKAAGNYFDSPAIGIADDGGDAGAFAYDYGDLVVTGTEFIMDTPNRNPDKVVRQDDTIKLAEGVQENGTTYTQVATFKFHYIFTWDQSANDMPAAQTLALRSIYETPDGHVLLDIGDGNGYVDAYVLRQTPFEYTDVTGMYSDDGVPEVVKQLDLRVQ